MVETQRQSDQAAPKGAPAPARIDPHRQSPTSSVIKLGVPVESVPTLIISGASGAIIKSAVAAEIYDYLAKRWQCERSCHSQGRGAH